jgi:hypothetical protein
MRRSQQLVSDLVLGFQNLGTPPASVAVGGVWGPADFAKRSASEAGRHTLPAATTNLSTPFSG